MNGKPVFTVPTKTVINFDSRFDKKLLCDGITFTAGNACVYDCTFCYVEDMQRKAMGWHEKHGVQYPPEGHSGVVIRIKDAVDVARKQILSKPESFRMAKKVIYSSPKVDVAGNMELVRETVEICKVILENTNWDIRLLSKSNLLPKVAQELWKWELGLGHAFLSEGRIPLPQGVYKRRIIYGVSTGTLDDKLAAAFEIGTAKVSKRIESIHWLQDNGFRTFGMICPSLPKVDYLRFAKDMANELRVGRMEHVWAEVINLRGDNFVKTEKALRDAGYHFDANNINLVSRDADAWENYAQDTFRVMKAVIPPNKLRFLQYVTKETEPYWWAERENGTVIL